MTKVHHQILVLVSFVKDGNALLPFGSDIRFSDNSVNVLGLDDQHHFGLSYFPPLPIDISQFGSPWWNEYWSRAFVDKYNLTNLGITNFTKTYYGPVYDSNALATGNLNLSNLALVGVLAFDREVQTQFEPLFASLNNMLQLCSNLLVSGINNIIPELRLIKTALDTLDIDVGDVSITTDDITTQLQNIYTILASQNANQAAICSAITNKDNQSNIVSELNKIFINNFEGVEYSALKLDTNVLSAIPDGSRTRYTLTSILARLMSLLTSDRRTLSSYFYDYNSSNFRTSNSSLFENATKTSFQNLHDITEKLNNIETKLEQNLPFATLTDVTLNVDTVKKCVTQDIKENSEI